MDFVCFFLFCHVGELIQTRDKHWGLQVKSLQKMKRSSAHPISRNFRVSDWANLTAHFCLCLCLQTSLGSPCSKTSTMLNLINKNYTLNSCAPTTDVKGNVISSVSCFMLKFRKQCHLNQCPEAGTCIFTQVFL